MQYHKYSLTEIENMIPWERDIHIILLLQALAEEKQKRVEKFQAELYKQSLKD